MGEYTGKPVVTLGTMQWVTLVTNSLQLFFSYRCHAIQTVYKERQLTSVNCLVAWLLHPHALTEVYNITRLNLLYSTTPFNSYHIQ